MRKFVVVFFARRDDAVLRAALRERPFSAVCGVSFMTRSTVPSRAQRELKSATSDCSHDDADGSERRICVQSDCPRRLPVTVASLRLRRRGSRTSRSSPDSSPILHLQLAIATVNQTTS